VLVPSVTPDDVKETTTTTTQAPLDTTLETRTASAEPLITPQTVSDSLTNEITPEGEMSTERLRETTLEPENSAEVEEEDSSDEYIGVTGSSEEPAESEEDETTTEALEPVATNNQTSTTLTTAGNSPKLIPTNAEKALTFVLCLNCH
jgi:hypothetical protein